MRWWRRRIEVQDIFCFWQYSLYGPLSVCRRYQNLFTLTFSCNWGVTKRDKSEWTNRSEFTKEFGDLRNGREEKFFQATVLYFIMRSAVWGSCMGGRPVLSLS